MKRFLTLLAVISMTLVAMAQHPMATRSRNGELTQFTGIYSLDLALQDTEFGDVIYLSEGEFLSASNDKMVPYGVSIVGCGYRSKILTDIWIGACSAVSMDVPILDGVNVKRVSQDANCFPISLEIRNCWIGELEWRGRPDNTYINCCYIENADFGIEGLNRNIYVNNSKIRRLGNDSQYIQVKNCNILKAQECPRILINSIIAGSTAEGEKLFGDGQQAVYNSLLPTNEMIPGEAVIRDCYFENPANGLIDENLNATIDLNAKGYLGQDGTIIGAYGGENPFSEYPSVPSIDSDKSSVEFDSTTNKLNVTITVASN